METIKITFKMSAAIMINSPLHFDGVLEHSHPGRHNAARHPSRSDSSRAGLEALPLPLASAYCGGAWVWACTAAEFPDAAKMSVSTITKRTTGEDLHNLYRNFTPATGTGKDRMVASTIIVTPEVYFYAIATKTKEVERLLKRVYALGGQRKCGYGVVDSWKIESVNIPMNEVLVFNGKARRRLHGRLCKNEAYKRLAVASPYWLSADAPHGFEVGDDVVLKEGIKYR